MNKVIFKAINNLDARIDALLGDRLTDEQLEEKALCENSFYYFLERAWPIIEPGQQFIPGWHAEAICEHLEALYYLEITRLIINCPPRIGKSNICCVAFAAWIWANDPHLSFLYSAYASSLSIRDSIKCRRLIQSDWYQSLWGSSVQLMADVNNKLRFDNTKGGYRIASSVGGSNTGFGGHFEICFPYETLITTDLGELPIGIIVEDKIQCKALSFNHETNQTEWQSINQYYKTDALDEMIEIELEDGTFLQCTPNHPIYVENKGYIKADELVEGDCVKKL